MDAQRLLHGERAYRDFFQFTPPGADLVYFAAFSVLGSRIWVCNLVVLLLGVVLCLLCWKLSKEILRPATARLATLLYLVLVFAETLNGTHHLFSVALVLAAALLLLRQREPPSALMAGALLGLASFFTQTRGAVAAAALIAWLTWESRHSREALARSVKSSMLLFASFVVSLLVLQAYYLATLGIRDLLFFQFTYVTRYVMSQWTLGLPALHSPGFLHDAFRWLLGCIALPAIYVGALWRCRAMSRAPSRSSPPAAVTLLVAVGSALFAEVAADPSWLRFFCVALPAIVLLLWLADDAASIARRVMPYLWAVLLLVATYQTSSKHRLYDTVQDLPAGRVATTEPMAEKLGWLQAHVKSGEYLLHAQWPSLYLPLDVRNPIYLDNILAPGADQLGYIALSIRQLQAKRVQYIVWGHRFDANGQLDSPFHQFLTSAYRPVRRFPDGDEVWERLP